MNTKYKILVLSDLKKNTSYTLKSTISLANMIGGDIKFFHVKKPVDIVEKDNQLSAMRSINNEYTVTEKKIKQLLQPFYESYSTRIQSSFSFGNVREEIEKCMNQYQPDIIVLGKRKANSLRIVGDQITQFVLKNFKGTVMIASDQNTLEPNKEISLGMLNGTTNDISHIDFAEDLIKNAQLPLKSFKIIKNSEKVEKNPTPSTQKMVEYVFEESDNVNKNLANYLSKNNINLLCVNRENNYPINKLNVSLLVAN